MEFLSLGGSDWLSTSTTGSGASATGSVTTTTRPGIVDLQTGTTSTGLARWSSWSHFVSFSSYSSALFEVVGGWPTLSTVSEEYASIIGFSSSNNALNPSNGCYFLEDRLPSSTAPDTGTITAGSTNLQCWCANGGTRTGYTMDGSIVSQGGFTTVATPIAALSLPSTNIYRMRVVVTPGVSAEFYVDSGAGLTKRCNITTNIPTTNQVSYVFNIIKSAGSTSRSLYVDWAHLALDMTATRSP